MKKMTPAPFLLAALFLLSLAVAAPAQKLVDASAKTNAGRQEVPAAPRAQAATDAQLVDAQATRSALSVFPDSQAVLFVNVQRVINEALPRVLPPGELDKAVAEARKVGVDLRGIEYLVAGVRFADPPPASGAPEFVVLLKGNFSADALMSLMRLGLDTQGIKPTQETYNSRTINIVNLTEALKPKDGSTAAPSKIPYTEIGATALDDHTLVIGVPGYVRAAIDAAGAGQGRLKSGLIDLAASHSNALTSLTIEVPESLPEYLRKTGMPPNEEIDRILSWLKQLSLSTGMTATDFNLQAAVQTDNAEHASAISGMIRMAQTAAESAARADIERKRTKPRESKQSQAALAALNTFVNRVEGNVVRLAISVPQTTVAELMKKSTPPAAPEKGKAPVRRRGRRTAKRG
ncbi:MAG TPA: hypothetical protein VM934_00140 [Pyrinomonadaceae bacterium]|jgi:hypothetical protein|nr:hypothetical protein [Pyrinomonadaceae bacterium]